VLPLTFNIPWTSGQITSCSCVVTPASGNLVITNLDFQLLVFRPVASVPFAAGSFVADNAAMAITAASYRELVARFTFVNTGWQNPAGAFTTGVTGQQTVIPGIGAASTRIYAPFYSGNEPGVVQRQQLIGVVQALAAWNDANVANRFDFALDLMVDAP
tara:strand:+ start:1588 stop:2064 length:477 start_codon:yes stop_codon:yes gene_type:complete